MSKRLDFTEFRTSRERIEECLEQDDKLAAYKLLAELKGRYSSHGSLCPVTLTRAGWVIYGKPVNSEIRVVQHGFLPLLVFPPQKAGDKNNCPVELWSIADIR